jgi:hypothetical protein
MRKLRKIKKEDFGFLFLFQEGNSDA